MMGDNLNAAVTMKGYGATVLPGRYRIVRQLKDEALVAMRLVHPNIVLVRAFEENNGNPFLVLATTTGDPEKIREVVPCQGK